MTRTCRVCGRNFDAESAVTLCGRCEFDGDCKKPVTVYAVFRHGVYRHECGGVFTSRESAEAVAKTLLSAEPDAHHRYEVVPFTLDLTPAVVSPTMRYDSPVSESEAVAVFERPAR